MLFRFLRRLSFHFFTRLKMKLKRFLLRYYPPGIILEYESKGERKTKDIDLLDLSNEYVYARCDSMKVGLI